MAKSQNIYRNHLRKLKLKVFKPCNLLKYILIRVAIHFNKYLFNGRF